MNAYMTGSWGVLSSSSAIVGIAGLLILLVAHKGIRAWTRAAHGQIREHLFGPRQVSLNADAQTPSADGAQQVTAGGSDDFDYGIYAQAHEFTPPETDEDDER